MPALHRHPSPRLLLAGLALFALATFVLAAPTATAALPAGPDQAAEAPTSTSAPAGPQLSITIADGRTSVALGDTLHTTITVRNLGTTRLAGLRISQTVPTGLHLTSADAGGRVTAGTVRWTTSVAPGRTVVLHTVARVTATPSDLLRLASVACVADAADGPPLVCASDSDLLPTGRRAAARAVAADVSRASRRATPASGPDGSSPIALALAVLVGAALVAGAFVVARRRQMVGRGRARGVAP